ncbi:MAG: DUF5597 domain-containing protein [Clostridium sp.]|nr:DUF5597 domain-containing protein [Clostridium sp.]
MKRIFMVLAFAIALSMAKAESQFANGRLTVDGKEFFICGGELGNSGATYKEDIDDSFRRLKEMNLNAVLAPVYWDMLEPEEGKFDFSQIDMLIEAAEREDMRVVPLWFGAWKNSMSCYAPAYVKMDTRRFPRARTSAGKALEIASPFYPELLKADMKAFGELCRYIAKRDMSSRVIMLQIENEIGMLEDARDYSENAEKAYGEGVPKELTAWLSAHKKELHPKMLAKWKENGSKKAGAWEEVFGAGLETDEIFQAWVYARYVQNLAALSKSVSAMPVYVNAALNSRGRKPGQYPSAGPLAHLKDVWKAAAPDVDMLSPDIYDTGFEDWTSQYAMADNTLFVPEAKRCDANGVQALYILGKHKAIGFSPFSIENGPISAEDNLAKAYDIIEQIYPFTASHETDGILLDADKESIEKIDGDLRMTISHYYTLPWDSAAADKANWGTTGGMIVKLAPMEYIIAGSGLVVKFEDAKAGRDQAQRGEDGFAVDGSSADATQAADRQIGILDVAQVKVGEDGTLIAQRRYNGDETHQGRHVRIPVGRWEMLRVRLYEY